LSLGAFGFSTGETGAPVGLTLLGEPSWA